MHRAAMTALLATALAACGRGDRAAVDSAAAGATTGAARDTSATAQQIGEASGMKTPESVRYDPELDIFFVSNIDGNPSRKDAAAAIVTVHDSLGTVRPFIESGKKGVKLDAPKGMFIQADTLWVADIDVVRGFHRRTGAPVRTIDLRPQRATFLNDIVVGGDGALYRCT